MPEFNEIQALRDCAIELVDILRDELVRTGVGNPVVCLAYESCLVEVLIDKRLLNSPEGKRSLWAFLRRRANETGACAVVTGFDAWAFVPDRYRLGAVERGLLAELLPRGIGALEAAGLGRRREAISVIVETRLIAVMVLQHYVRTAQGIEFGPVQCADTTQTGVELCGSMRVFQNPIPA